mgnify:CR=1 FL=1
MPHINDSVTFASIYKDMSEYFKNNYDVTFETRGSQMAREMINANLDIPVTEPGVSFFSHPTHRVVPIRFVLAEMCAILAGRNDIAVMESYNKGIRKYSNDGITLGASYGEKLEGQLAAVLLKLQKDLRTRQAVCSILQKFEVVNMELTHIPCNVFLQFFVRDEKMHLIVTSRSSDFVTGFSIDTIHWQLLLMYMANSLLLSCGNVHYNIGSLHVYGKDIEMLKGWDVTEMYGVPFQHFIKTNLTLMEAIAECQKNFTINMSVEELGKILGFDAHSIAICRYNDDMFRLYRNKLER